MHPVNICEFGTEIFEQIIIHEHMNLRGSIVK